jgi:YHS domain-containing protein
VSNVKVKDPVCGMWIEPEEAAATSMYESQTVYFCADQCRRDFEADPARYYDRLERNEPPFTVSHGMAAPKFGSAGSGGLEDEPVPRPRER